MYDDDDDDYVYFIYTIHSLYPDLHFYLCGVWLAIIIMIIIIIAQNKKKKK